MFPETQWTELAHATLHGNETGRAALDALCRGYWEPVRRFILQRGWRVEDADDLAQGFFVYLMENGILRRAERERGRFRSFLQGVLNHFLLEERDRRAALKRGGGVEHVAVEEDAAHTAAGAEHEFDRQWALAVMRRATEHLQAECVEKRGDDGYALLAPYLGGPGEPLPQEQIAPRLGLTHGGLRSEIHGWRQRLRELLRAEVRRTVAAPHEVEDEMSYLRQLLGAG
jgi:RNA polymerase sigma-70 factor (ECF subfamily)